LLDRVGQGDLTAFGQLYDATAARVFGLLLAILRDSGLTDEVTQDVFFEIWRRASTFDPTKGASISWIFTLAHSRAIDRVRQVRSLRARDTFFATNSYYPEFDSAAESATCHEGDHQIRAALAQLTPLQRQAIRLTYLMGHTTSEASEILGVPISTFKTRVRAGLIALRGILSVDNPPPD